MGLDLVSKSGCCSSEGGASLLLAMQPSLQKCFQHFFVPRFFSRDFLRLLTLLCVAALSEFDNSD